MKLRVDGARVCAELEVLTRFCDEPGSWARRPFGAADGAARAWLRELAAEAGLGVRSDAAGNLFFRLEGDDASLPAVATGSHTDAGPQGDGYDGTLGVLGGLEALRAIRRSGAPRRRAIELVLLAAKEPTRFATTCLGSRLLGGAMEGEVGDALLDRSGRTLHDVREEAGYAGELSEVALHPGHWSAWVELHLEEGSRLRETGGALGVVTAIAAPANLRYTVRGEPGHAGATPMPARRDALCAAAELVLEIENAGRRSGSLGTVTTVSEITVRPGTPDSVPDEVQLTVEVGDPDPERQARALRQVRAAVRRVEAERGVHILEETQDIDEPMRSAPELVSLLEGCAAEHGEASLRLVSRAYHDTLFLARVAPAAMLCLPKPESDGQLSAETVRLGTAVLAETLLHLAAAEPAQRGVA